MGRTRTGARRHTHRYYKLEDGLWHCSLPDCTHYMPLNMPSNVMIGKASICWDCGQEFRMGEGNLEYNRPICFNCISGLKQRKIEDIDDILNERIREAKLKKQQEEREKRLNESV